METNLNQNEKAKPNIDFKGRFFAQYWGQNVLFNNIKGTGFHSVLGFPIEYHSIIDKCSLQLKPLTKIALDDASEVAKIFGMTEDFEFIGKMLCIGHFDNSDNEKETLLYNFNAKAIDYLRSKGYALPFMGYSVEDLISFGWVQLL